MTEFPQRAIESIGFYVYTLADPVSGEVFYVGKGTGNRMFAHVNAALESPLETEKLERIREIRASGNQVRFEVIRHGMTEDQALEVESALIDFIGLPQLSNAVAGFGMESRGRMRVEEICALYTSEPIVIKEPALLIIINRLFRRNMGAEELYEISRGNWVLGERRNKAKYALSVYRGVVREVYRITAWTPAVARSSLQKRQARWRFDGEAAMDLRHYVGGSVEAYLKPGAQSPTRYINC